ncbi:DNA repair protein RAD18 [Klebsormidium nitens]|uniref:DNA repair protein RAD18 n=1 Tax=Klebsormidium nitens TaxID=105231 RepID=A0A1Y1IH23_KLENI|nr:DNA repair protein RAD18 [Klebsormidium nitens]|eukprot:GAQ90174.1 DNA repair protein RAD18 [Klebsormidium nitens]
MDNDIDSGEEENPGSARRMAGGDVERITAGPILEIVMENFMCHSNTKVELSPRVNFITGQNGSGKSAILTAICVTFGASAKNTQRASSAKDFIKNGEQYFKVTVVLMNEGEDAYQHHLFGDRIIIERQVTAAGSSGFKLKSSAGKIVYTKRDELDKMVDHFNINVENPCTVMSQDKVKQFLHTGSATDRYKYYFSATMLEGVSDQLRTVTGMVQEAEAILEERKRDLVPLKREWEATEAVLKEAEQIKDLQDELARLTVNYAWSWVYKVDASIAEAEATVDDITNNKVPVIGQKIAEAQANLDVAKAALEEKKASSGDTDETDRLRDEKARLEGELKATYQQQASAQSEIKRAQTDIAHLARRRQDLERSMQQARDKMEQQTQAETSERDREIAEKRAQIDAAQHTLQEIEARETEATEAAYAKRQEMQAFGPQKGELEQRLNDANGYLRRLNSQQKNAETAFGDKVPQLKAAIQRKRRNFSREPIGPIGAELSLTDDKWKIPVEECAGKVFNNFIVNSFEDMKLLKQCAKEANTFVNVVIYNFDHAPYAPRPDQLPDARLLTIRHVLQTGNHTVMNVLMDQCSIESVVLAESYEQAKAVAFTPGNKVKEAYLADGTKSFLRGQSETTQSYNPQTSRPPRLGVDVREQARQVQATARQLKEELDQLVQQQRGLNDQCNEAEKLVAAVKREKAKALQAVNGLERDLSTIERAAKAAVDAAKATPEDEGAELEEELATIDADRAELEAPLPDLQRQAAEAADKTRQLKQDLAALTEKATAFADAAEEALREIYTAEKEVKKAEKAVEHYQQLLPGLNRDLEAAEAKVAQEKASREQILPQAEELCPESDVTERFTNPDKVKAKMDRMDKKIKAQEARNGGTLDELHKRCKRAQKKFVRLKKSIDNVAAPLQTLQEGLRKRQKKLSKNAKLYKQEISWSFNSNLHKKGFTGKVDVDYSAMKLTLEVTTADGSNQAVTDTRALSGGERSFSTVAFALALHDLSESPFRAMDEFDVFMDSVNRKLSLQTVVDFAVKHKSQWMFITPHDIRDVKPGPYVKIQQMHAPRP